MKDTTSLTQLIIKPLNNPLTIPYNYTVKPGDTLSRIIANHYGVQPHNPRYKFTEASVIYHNRFITNPNKIYPGQVLRFLPVNESDA